MKEFNVVIGNPPYDDSSTKVGNIKLWNKFVAEALNHKPEYIAYITPVGLLMKHNSLGRDLRKKIDTAGYGFVYIKDHITSMFKNVNIHTCHWIIQRNSINNIEPLIDTLTLSEESIIQKVISYYKKLKLIMFNNNIKKSDLSNSGKKIYYSGNKLRYTDKMVDGSNLLKLVFPFSTSYKKMFITEEATGMFNLVFLISSKEEGDIIISYANSKLFNFVARRYKKTSGFTPFVKGSMIPDLRRTTPWTNQELYDLFNLTSEEVDYIENLT